jgi:hypothetical protein
MESRYNQRDLDKKYGEILRTAKETEAIGAATCETLNNQTRVIDRITDKNYEVSGNIDKSERLVRGMNSFFGRVKNYFTKPKITDPRPVKVEKSEGYKSCPRPVASTFDPQPLDKPFMMSEEYFLDQLSSSANNLRTMASEISSTLDEHNRKLDVANDLTQKNRDRIENLNFKAKRLLQ